MSRQNNIIQRMAEVMIERTAASGACTEDELTSAGFTDAEIKLYTTKARNLAKKEMHRETA